MRERLARGQRAAAQTANGSSNNVPALAGARRVAAMMVQTRLDGEVTMLVGGECGRGKAALARTEAKPGCCVGARCNGSLAWLQAAEINRTRGAEVGRWCSNARRIPAGLRRKTRRC
ncbi:hypothetical protein ZWY2020_053025 [Hordeum vulgare]|nr:hypothetical protein ZWY2020_053025 [Hordeum vulgare]